MQGSNQVRRTSKATSFFDRNLHFPRQVHKSKSLKIETFIVQLKSPSLYQSHKSKKALPESTMTVMNKWVCYNLRTWLRTELSRLNYKLYWRELDRGNCFGHTWRMWRDPRSRSDIHGGISRAKTSVRFAHAYLSIFIAFYLSTLFSAVFTFEVSTVCRFEVIKRRVVFFCWWDRLYAVCYWLQGLVCKVIE